MSIPVRPRSSSLVPMGLPATPADQQGPHLRHPLDLPSSKSQATLAEVRGLAAFDSVNVCLVGPSGSGKSLYAREVHNHSPRRNRPYVQINLAAVAKGFAPSDLLGHVRGAFTGADFGRVGTLLSAQGGTLVLDEITKASRAVQHILLQLFDRTPIRPLGADRDVEADVRLVALTSTTLERSVSAGKLIPDLFERLKPFVVEISALCDRRRDIGALIEYFLSTQYARFRYRRPPEPAEDLLAVLQAYPFSGNHRELEGILQRTMVNASGSRVLRAAHLPRLSGGGEARQARSKRELFLMNRADPSARVFVSAAEEARHYGISLSTLHRWRALAAGS